MVVINLAHGNDREFATKKVLEELLRKYDLSPYLFTKTVQVESMVIPHSHPVLTLNTRHIKNPDQLLSNLLHEQIHWFMDAHDESTNQAIDELKKMFPSVPAGGREGARDEFSTYLHLAVCWLELQADKRYLGEQKAYALIRSADVYTWIYKQVIDREGEIGEILKRFGIAEVKGAS